MVGRCSKLVCEVRVVLDDNDDDDDDGCGGIKLCLERGLEVED